MDQKGRQPVPADYCGVTNTAGDNLLDHRRWVRIQESFGCLVAEIQNESASFAKT
jgi:hypothetical protein